MMMIVGLTSLIGMKQFVDYLKHCYCSNLLLMSGQTVQGCFDHVMRWKQAVLEPAGSLLMVVIADADRQKDCCCGFDRGAALNHWTSMRMILSILTHYLWRPPLGRTVTIFYSSFLTRQARHRDEMTMGPD